MSIQNQKKQRWCLFAGIMVALFITGAIVRAKEISIQQNIAEEVFRFHVLANSDGKEDQDLKMKVKEEILAYMKKELPESHNVEETRAWAVQQLEKIEKKAREIIVSNGYDYQVNAEVTKCYFPDKTYGDVTFPAGKYEALRIEIGEAKGQNWWCVLYPNLCFFDAVHAVVPEAGKQELQQVLEEDAYEMVTATTQFRIRWFFF